MAAESLHEQVGETRPYQIVEGGEAVREIEGFQLSFAASGTAQEDPDERRFVALINGAVTQLCDNALRNRPGSVENNKLLPALLDKRLGWVGLLRREAEEFLQRHPLYECTKACAMRMGEIEASIRHVLEQNGRTKQELSALSAVANEKRHRLLAIGSARRSLRQHLHLLAGFGAILSGTSVTAALPNVYSSALALQILSAVVAFLSGITTLIASTYFDEKETATILEGASDFLALRSKSELAEKNSGTTEAQAFKALEGLNREYVGLSTKYDRFLHQPWFLRFGKW